MEMANGKCQMAKEDPPRRHGDTEKALAMKVVAGQALIVAVSVIGKDVEGFVLIRENQW